MSVLAGKDGTISVGGAVGYVDNWTLNINGGAEEISALGNDWKTFLGTASDWSGSCSGSFNNADTGQSGAITGFGTNAEIDVLLTLNTSTTFGGKAYVTNVSLGASHSGKVTFSCQFQGSKALSVGFPVA